MPGWTEFKPSTFTMVARNSAIMRWALGQFFSPVTTIGLLGSGVLDPFIVAAQAKNAHVTAVEIHPDLLNLGESIKRGESISWETIATASQNPGRPNSDLLDKTRLTACINRLDRETLTRLGPNFNMDGMQVDPSVSERVTFVEQDALTAIGVMTQMQIVGDFFLQVNINKNSDTKFGINYTRRLVATAPCALTSDGLYIVGDTGKNFPTTLEHFAEAESSGVGMLAVASMVHAVNLGDAGFITSHYLVSTPDPDWLNTQHLEEQTIKNILSNPLLKRVLAEPKFEEVLLTELANKTKGGAVNLAYLGGHKSQALNINDTNALSKIVSRPNDEFSSTIALPAQKEELELTPTP